jgi:hypothetical protein
MRAVPHGPDREDDCEESAKPVNLECAEKSEQLLAKWLAELAVMMRKDAPMQKRVCIKQNTGGPRK